jgi:carbamoyltransferase
LLAEDAFRCCMGSEMETLIVGNALLRMYKQPRHLAEVYKNRFEGD